MGTGEWVPWSHDLLLHRIPLAWLSWRQFSTRGEVTESPSGDPELKIFFTNGCGEEEELHHWRVSAASIAGARLLRCLSSSVTSRA